MTSNGQHRRPSGRVETSTSEGARPRQSPRRFRLRHGRLQHRPPAQAYGRKGRTPSSDMKSDRTRARRPAKTSKTCPVRRRKVAPASLVAQTQSLFQQPAKAFSGLIESGWGFPNRRCVISSFRPDWRPAGMAEPLSMDLRTRFACGGGRWSVGTKGGRSLWRERRQRQPMASAAAQAGRRVAEGGGRRPSFAEDRKPMRRRFCRRLRRRPT